MSIEPDIVIEVERHFAKRILEVVRDGEIVTDSSGAVVMKGDEPLRACPSAAMMGVVRQWIKENKRKAPAGEADTTQDAINRILQAQAQGGHIPPLDTDGDDATSR